jgi:SAM-dependent methyltransferase
MQPINEDVIGEALLDYVNGDCSEDIIVKSLFEDDIIPVPYLFRSADQLPEIEKKALSLCKGKILDIGAGSGCHSIILQQKKLTVKAIDISKGAVEVMTKRGVNACQNNFFEEKGKYDTLLLLMNGVGIAGTLEGLEKLLIKAKTLLNTRGQILLDSSDIAYMFLEDDGSMNIDLNASYYGEVSYQMQYKTLQTKSFNWLFVNFDVLKSIANKLGFQCKLIFNGSHYDYLAQLYI